MFQIYFIAQACCQLLLCAKQNHHHKFFCSHMEPWMGDYTGNEEHLYRVWQLPYTFNLHHPVCYMNNKNNMGIILQFEHIDTYAGLPRQSIFIFSLPMEWENEIYFRNISPSSGCGKSQGQSKYLVNIKEHFSK